MFYIFKPTFCLASQKQKQINFNTALLPCYIYKKIMFLTINSRTVNIIISLIRYGVFEMFYLLKTNALTSHSKAITNKFHYSMIAMLYLHLKA